LNTPVNPRNVGVGLLIGILLGLVAVVATRCSEGESPSPFGPSGLPVPTLPSSIATSSTNPPIPTPGVNEDTPQGCGFNLLRAGIKDDGGHFYVPVEGAALDEIIIYVWIERVNDGTQYGPFDPNAWFDVNPGYGTFKYQLAVERDRDGDGKADDNCQDDRHHGTFTIVPPPPPPGCQGEGCNPPPSCDVEKLSSEASEECSYGYSLNQQECSFTCNPPPSCDLEDLASEADEECSYGFSLNEQQCSFTCNPPPPPCPFNPQIPITDPACIPPPPCPFNPAIPITDPACVPPPPGCDVEELTASAILECENLGYTLDTEVCEFSCNPPPQCDIAGLESLLASDERCVPPPECTFGDAFLDQGLIWECPPPPPSCKTDPDLCPCEFNSQILAGDPACVPPEEHGQCFYEVSGKNKQADCTAAGGTFSSHDGSDHCVFEFPGISQNGFNLNPGISDPDCLRKQDSLQ